MENNEIACTANVIRRINAGDNEPVEDDIAYCAYCLLPWHLCECHRPR